MALDLGKRTIDFLQARPDTQFTVRQIAQWIFDNFPKECAEKKAASKGGYLHSDDDVVNQLAKEIASSRPRWQRQYRQFKTTESRPRLYYWTEKDASEEVASAEASDSVANSQLPKHSKPNAPQAAPKLTEHDIYPRLAAYLHAAHGVNTCRIDEKCSSNKAGSGANEWLHPDMVGLEDLSSDWTRDLRECVSVIAERRARLWSFEAKLLLNRSNVRKSYFQAVSNSSWAHCGYLVASTIEGDGTMRELTMLAATHGIGIILLDTSVPSESQILIPARERAEIDWDMCNRLTEENSDFVKYIEKIKHFYQTAKIITAQWMPVDFE